MTVISTNTTQSLVDLFKMAKKAIKNNKLDEARDILDFGIIILASKRDESSTDEDIVEGTKRGLWYERFWGMLEKHDLLLS